MKSKRILGIIGIFIALTALSATVAAALPFQVGDVFASVSNGQVQHYDKNGILLETLDTGLGGFTTGMAFDSNGNLYVTNFNMGDVVKFDSSGTKIGSFGSGYSGSPESILFDASGNAYVGAVDGDNDVRMFDAAGNPLNQFDVQIESRGSDWIDLAADQCTLYYTSEGYRIMRYDVCNDVQLADFATLDHRPSYALRLLSGGGLLVANNADIHRLNSFGTIINTYDVDGQDNWFALNLDPDGTSFWSGDHITGKFFKFDIASGTVLMSVDTGMGSNKLFGLAVFGEQTAALGSISGMKFNDLNGNGVEDPGEPGLEGWIIKLTKPDGITVETTTDSNGDYIFGSLLIGTYTVEEVLQPGWTQTAPPGGTYTVDISAGDHVMEVDFGNSNTGSISGMKFNDLNSNGVKDPGEPGLADWKIILTKPDGTTVETTTDSNGDYKFDNLLIGEYIVGEVLQPGYIQTAPEVSEIGSATYTVGIKGGSNVIGKDFGNFKLGIVQGMKWEDLNANGKKDSDENGLEGWEINIKGFDTITGEEVDITKTTDTDGNYEFTDLTAGKYVISEKLQDGWVQTWPTTTGTYEVTIVSGTIIKKLDFGNFKKGKITGGGYIPAPDGPKATFGLVGQYPNGKDTAIGNVEYQDHTANLNIKSIQINTVAITMDKTKGVITGLAQVNGAGSYPFEVYIEDNGEPGKGTDVFRINLPTYPYSNGDVLSFGNIQIHK
ncbi:hypothetical protein KA005_69455 [bacterium]|nr:hypothetical protein [bacterium]